MILMKTKYLFFCDIGWLPLSSNLGGAMDKIKELKKRFLDWYSGKHVGMSDEGGIYISGHIKRPWLAIVVGYVRREYKWIIASIIALLLLWIAYHRS